MFSLEMFVIGDLITQKFFGGHYGEFFSLLRGKLYTINHYCPVKVGESFLEIAEIKSFMSSFESQRTWTNANQRAVR